MTTENDFLQWANGGGANVDAQSAFAARSTLTTGLASGIVPSTLFNKLHRQSATMAALIAAFIVQQTGQPAIDDGTLSTLLANLTAAVAGRLLNVQTITSSGTYTPTPGTTSIIVELVGGGGAGGGVQATSGSQIAIGSGAGGAAYAKGRFTSGFTGGLAVTIGAGGVGSSTTTGGAGGTTSLGSLISAAGSPGAGLSTAVTYSAGTPTANGNGSPASAVTGANILSVPGKIGPIGISVQVGFIIGGGGGDSYLGGGGLQVNGADNNGNAATGYGGGGSGAVNGLSQSARPGGNGGNGYMIIYEFA